VRYDDILRTAPSRRFSRLTAYGWLVILGISILIALVIAFGVWLGERAWFWVHTS
jgi:hypothetical protein